MVVIRLARTGKKKQAFYRVVVADSKRAVTSKFIEIVGWYNPHSKELDLKKDQIENWLKKGAVPSNTVAVLLKNEGVKLPEWVKITEKVKKPKKEAEEKKQVAEKPAKEVAEETEEVVEEEESNKSEGKVDAAEGENEKAPASEADTPAE